MQQTGAVIMERLDASTRLKVDVMFEGIRYSEALGNAVEHALPNYYPYRFKPDEPNPTGKPQVAIPYLIRTPDGTMIRVKGNGESDWVVEGDKAAGYRLRNATAGDDIEIRFEPMPEWMRGQTSDGFPMAQAGVSLHSDMMVINVAPGCEYFLHKHDGESMRCRFCSYGAPDERTAHLGQVAGQLAIPAITLSRMQETVTAALGETPIRHIYLVGGSLTDWREEGERFLQLARAVKEINRENVPVTLGSGALPDDLLQQFHDEALVDNVCFNLEVWSEPLFAKVCPGKNRYVGYDRWIASLETAVSLWGRGRVYSAMVAGIELEPEHEMDWLQAADLCIAGAEDLCSRGIIPIYSLYWPIGGKNHPDYMSRLRSFFERLNIAYAGIREKNGLVISDKFMCHRCAYMQLECDIDRNHEDAA
ncbi:MAG: hypothetical protein C0629_10205 [Chromatiales bacterium]|nr:MAG: hypothetical protein C0629_10205 [Chromatiales bacterium]